MADDRASVVKQVKEANDIVDVIGTYVTLRPVGRKFKGLCPFHEDTHPSFDVDPDRQRYKCWACGKYGDVLSFVQEFEHVTFPEALELLVHRAMGKDREVRYQNFSELLLDSEAILVDLQRERAAQILVEVKPLMDAGDLETAEAKLLLAVELDPGSLFALHPLPNLLIKLFW